MIDEVTIRKCAPNTQHDHLQLVRQSQRSSDGLRIRPPAKRCAAISSIWDRDPCRWSCSLRRRIRGRSPASSYAVSLRRLQCRQCWSAPNWRLSFRDRWRVGSSKPMRSRTMNCLRSRGPCKLGCSGTNTRRTSRPTNGLTRCSGRAIEERRRALAKDCDFNPKTGVQPIAQRWRPISEPHARPRKAAASDVRTH